MKTPILFIIFNRPNLTQRVFDVIRTIKPENLYIAADGPREKNSKDIDLCSKTRDIVSNIDWDCNIKTNFRDRNLGCRESIVQGIDWLFEEEEMGIILEDDCLPSKTFFTFCETLLEKYLYDEKIMQINGNFRLHNIKNFKESYYFSKLNATWGWATWKRAWLHFDHNMTDYKINKKNGMLKNYYEHEEIYNWMKMYFEEAIQPNCNIWSTRWAYAIAKNDGLNITPTQNLVENIGLFDNPTSKASDTYKIYEDFKPQEIKKVTFLKEIIYDKENDGLEYEHIIKVSDFKLNQSLMTRIILKLKKLLRPIKKFILKMKKTN